MARKATGRKRERGDHSLEPNKREHSDTTDERYMEPTLRLEDMEEVEELTDPVTGGLAFPAGVIKMLDIMHTVQLDSSAPMHTTEMALAKRALLAKIVASTSRADCAALFFHEGGLDALQAWLREAVQAAPDFPTCRAHIDALLVALLIAVERTREPPSRLQEATLAIIHRLSAAECQFSDQVRLRAVRLGRSWGADHRHRTRVWDCGDSSTTSGAEVAMGSKDDPSPSTTSTERDDTTEAVSAASARPGGHTGTATATGVGVGVAPLVSVVGSAGRDGDGPWGGDALAGVEEAAGGMRLVTMNSPVAVAASHPSAPSFGVAGEERRQSVQRESGSASASASGSRGASGSGSASGGLLGGEAEWSSSRQDGKGVGDVWTSAHAHIRVAEGQMRRCSAGRGVVHSAEGRLLSPLLLLEEGAPRDSRESGGQEEPSNGRTGVGVSDGERAVACTLRQGDTEGRHCDGAVWQAGCGAHAGLMQFSEGCGGMVARAVDSSREQQGQAGMLSGDGMNGSS